MAIIVPIEPEESAAADARQPTRPARRPATLPSPPPPAGSRRPSPHRHASRVATAGPRRSSGVVLILFGALALIDAFLPVWADGGRFLWPAFIVGIGALLVVTAVRREPNES